MSLKEITGTIARKGYFIFVLNQFCLHWFFTSCRAESYTNHNLIKKSKGKMYIFHSGQPSLFNYFYLVISTTTVLEGYPP